MGVGRVRALDQQADAERRQAFRFALEERLRGLAQPTAMMEAATALVGQHLAIAQVGFAEVQEDGEHVLVARDWNDGRLGSVVGRWRMDDFGSQFAREMKAGETVSIPDVRLDPRTCATEVLAAYDAIQVRAMLDIPLVKDGRMVAMLFVHHPEVRAWERAEVTLAEDVCERLWSSVERAHAEGERARTDRLREAQTQVLETAVRDTPLPQALEMLVHIVEGLSHSGVLASVLLLDDDSLHLRHGAGPSLPRLPRVTGTRHKREAGAQCASHCHDADLPERVRHVEESCNSSADSKG